MKSADEKQLEEVRDHSVDAHYHNLQDGDTFGENPL